MPFVACPNLSDNGLVQYWQPGSELMVGVSGETIREISSAFGRHRDVIDRYRPQSREIWDSLTPDNRAEWFAANEPDGSERHDWWLYHCIIIGASAEMIHFQDMRDEYVDYARWAWRTAVDSGLIAPAVAAIHLAETLPEVETGGLPPTEQPSDAIVAECLSHVTGLMSRTDKNLIVTASKTPRSRRSSTSGSPADGHP